VEDEQTDNESSYFAPLVTLGVSLADSDKGQVLVDVLETKFQPLTVPSVDAIIEIVDEELRSHFLTPDSEPKFTKL
jgi:hypothetical protein